ncbi:ankyrin repeat-containing domain protein [Mycena rebaudengoi]|nr:ankyrin repeat-containing domain protein [Mycena rebaudengoi]
MSDSERPPSRFRERAKHTYHHMGTKLANVLKKGGREGSEYIRLGAGFSQPTGCCQRSARNRGISGALAGFEGGSAFGEATAKPRESSKESAISSNISVALAIVEQVGKVIEAAPFVEPIGAILLQLVKVYKQIRDNDGKRAALIDKVALLSTDIAQAILRLTDDGHAAQIKRLGSDLREYQKLLKHAQRLLSVEHKKFVRMLKQDGLGAELDALDKQLDLFGTRFRSNRLVDLQLAQAKVAATVTQVLNTVTEDQLEKWLNAPDPKEKQTSSYNLRQESTCLWLLEHERFMHWQDYPGELLWIEGSSGTGKTVLSSTIIEHLFQDRQTLGLKHSTTIAYFYFDFGDSRKQFVENAIRRLILKISAQCPKPYETLQGYHSTYSGQKGLTHQQLLTLLQKLLGELGRTYIVLDALDECSAKDHQILVEFIQTILSWAEVRLHILVTSQRREIFTETFPSLERYSGIVLEEEIIARDIQLAPGCFAWLLVYSSNSPTAFWKKTGRKTLAELPNDLFGIYDRFLGTVPPSAMVYVEAALRWIVFTASPVTMEQLADAEIAGHRDIFNFLLEHKVNIKLHGLSALEAACTKGHLEFVQRLLELGARVTPDHPNVYRVRNPLLAASRNGWIAIVRLLLEHNANPNDGSTLYHVIRAAPSLRFDSENPTRRANRINIVQLLLENGANPDNAPDPSRRHFSFAASFDAAAFDSPLINACHNLDQDIVHLLLKHGANPNIGTPFTAAVKDETILRMLLKNGAKIGPKDGVFSYLRDTTVETACLLLDHGAADHIEDVADGLRLASQSGREDIVRLLVQRGLGGDLAPALARAVSNGHLKIVEFLLANGADVNGAGDDGTVFGQRDDRTVLQVACQQGVLDIVRVLLDQRADVNAARSKSANPLQATASCDYHFRNSYMSTEGVHVSKEEYHKIDASRRTEIVRLLLEKGADVNVQGGRYGSALQAASKAGHVEIGCILLENGADVLAVGGKFGTALFAAVAGKHIDMVQLLLDNGAEINSSPDVLRIACRTRDPKLLEFLLQKGAAAVNGFPDVVRILLDNGANQRCAAGGVRNEG